MFWYWAAIFSLVSILFVGWLGAAAFFFCAWRASRVE